MTQTKKPAKATIDAATLTSLAVPAMHIEDEDAADLGHHSDGIRSAKAAHRNATKERIGTLRPRSTVAKQAAMLAAAAQEQWATDHASSTPRSNLGE